MESKIVRANAIGFTAVLMWGSFGVLGAMSSELPPFLMLSVCFMIAAAIGQMICWKNRWCVARPWRLSILISAALLSADHSIYLTAYHFADPLPVSIINFLWPGWLVVIGNMFFKLKSGKAGYLAAVLGFLGVFILVTGDGLSMRLSDVTGYGLATLAAIFWALYSNVRRIDKTPAIAAMTSISFVSGIICGVIGWLIGELIPPLSNTDLLVVFLLAIGPAGCAFYFWEYGMKHGNAALLGILGYCAPVVSTVLLIFFGMGQLTWQVFAAVILISSGGFIVQFKGQLFNE